MYNVRWLGTMQSTIQIEVLDHWRWDRFDRALYAAFQMMREVRYSVVLILDMASLPTIPEPAVNQIQDLFTRCPKNMARVVLVSHDELVQWHFTLLPSKQFIVVQHIDEVFS